MSTACSLLAKLKRSARLPSPPGTALQILQLCQSNDVCIGDLADTLAADPALSLRLLKYANSALVGASKEVTTVREAVLMLGIRSVRLMALSFSLVSTNDPRACQGFDYDRFWAHSVACAVGARYLAGRAPNKPVPPEEAFAAGLLAHIGKLVFAVGVPENYPEVLQVSGGTLGRSERNEAACLGTSHLDLGADLMAEWGVPERLCSAVRHQGKPNNAGEDDTARLFASIVGTATDIADIICQAAADHVLSTRRQSLFNSRLFHGQEDTENAIGAIRKEFSELAGILSVKQGMVRTADEIQAEAGEILSELSLAAQLQSDGLEEQNRGLQQKAWTDALTGINNRAAFDEQLNALWKDALDGQRPIALILMDIDHFKKFNDTYGHQTGDAVLTAVGGALPKAVRSVDFVARYGGEEFAVILPNADRMTAASVAVRVRKSIEALVVRVGTQEHKVTISVGVAFLVKAFRGCNPALLIEAADKQLYCSKEKGRNCCSMKQLQPATRQPATV